MFSMDFFNGLFEFGGAFMLGRNCVQLHRDKMVRGVHWHTVAFFAGWGIWNLFYYPSLNQIWSFAGGVALVAANLTWLAQAAYYKTYPRTGEPA